MAHDTALIDVWADRILDSLPYGSGVDCDWTWQASPNKLVFYNSYHCMNEYGGYVGYADFSVTIKLDQPIGDFRLQFHGKYSAYLNARYGLREYLEHLIHFCLTEELVA